MEPDDQIAFGQPAPESPVFPSAATGAPARSLLLRT